MKTFKIIQIFFIIILCTSCNNDDDGETFNGRTVINITEKTQLYGTWRYESLTVEKAVDLNDDGVQNTNLLLELPPCVIDDVYILNANGTYEIKDSSVCSDDLQRFFLGPIGRYAVEEKIDVTGNVLIDVEFILREVENGVEGFGWSFTKELQDGTTTRNKRYLKYLLSYRNFGLETPSNFDQGIIAVMVSDNTL